MNIFTEELKGVHHLEKKFEVIYTFYEEVINKVLSNKELEIERVMKPMLLNLYEKLGRICIGNEYISVRDITLKDPSIKTIDDDAKAQNNSKDPKVTPLFF